jgi:hypothetical protein
LATPCIWPVTTNLWLQLKLVCIGLAGLNLLVFYVSGMARVVEGLGPFDRVPPLAQLIGATSLALWTAVVYFGRLIPWDL